MLESIFHYGAPWQHEIEYEERNGVWRAVAERFAPIRRKATRHLADDTPWRPIRQGRREYPHGR